MKKKILIFGLNLEKLKSIRDFFDEKGLETICSVDLEMGEDLISQEDFGCLLLDHKLLEGEHRKRVDKVLGGVFPKTLVFLESGSRDRVPDLQKAGIGRHVLHSGNEEDFLRDLHKSVLGLLGWGAGKGSLADSDWEGQSGKESDETPGLMDEIARMSSKLEETLIRETQLRKELEEANRIKDELMSFAAHDLRSPMATILSTIDLMLNPKMEIGPLNAEQQRFLTSIRNQAQNLIGLVDELLDFSKIKSGFVDLNLTSLDMGALISEKCDYHSIAAGKKSIALFCELGKDLPIVNVDKNKISSVLDNFIGNAIKYCSSGDRVTVRSHAEKGELRVEVEDTGPGLGPEEMKKAFGAFQKLSARPTGGEKSTGLGLAIVKKIVEAHGGRVGVQSEKGKGSVFYFILK